MNYVKDYLLVAVVMNQKFFLKQEVKKAKTNTKHQVHDLMGRKLGDDMDISQLPKGTYIIDGQKTLIR